MTNPGPSITTPKNQWSTPLFPDGVLIGQSATDQVGFFGTTPIQQPAALATAANSAGSNLYSAALSPVAVAANTTAEQTFTVTGLQVGQQVSVSKPSAQAGLGIVNARVSAVNTLAITFSNNTGASITPTAAETYLITATGTGAAGSSLLTGIRAALVALGLIAGP